MRWGVIPTIRVLDMPSALDFYQNKLGFTLDRGDPGSDNSALTRGVASFSGSPCPGPANQQISAFDITAPDSAYRHECALSHQGCSGVRRWNETSIFTALAALRTERGLQ